MKGDRKDCSYPMHIVVVQVILLVLVRDDASGDGEVSRSACAVAHQVRADRGVREVSTSCGLLHVAKEPIFGDNVEQVAQEGFYLSLAVQHRAKVCQYKAKFLHGDKIILAVRSELHIQQYSS